MHDPLFRLGGAWCGIGALLAACLSPSAGVAEPGRSVTLDELSIAGEGGSSTRLIGAPPLPYAGGQVASGQRLGLLGNRSFMEIPFSATSYTERYIRDQQARTLSEVLASDPSVRVTTPRFGFSDQISVRGFTLNAGDATFDGLGGIMPPRRLPLEGIERVELIRGPGTLLTGSPASINIGGTLNYVPKRATDLAITRVTPGFIGDGNLGTAVDLGRRFGDGNALGLRINGAFRDGATPLDGETERVGNVSAGFDYRGEGMRASLDGGAFAFRQQKYSQVILGLAPGALVPRPPPATTTLSAPWQRAPIEGAYGMGRVEFDLSDATTLGLGYGRSYTSERTVQTFLSNLTTQGNVTATPATFPFWSRSEGADATLRTHFATRFLTHELALAANRVFVQQSFAYRFPLGPNTIQSVYRPFVIPEPSVAGIDFYPRKTSQSALGSLALADTIATQDGRLQLTIGGRRQWIETQAYAIETGARAERYEGEGWAPAYGLLFRPVEPLAFYANSTEGLVLGPTAPLGTRNAGEILPPSPARQVEAGVKLDLNGFGAQVALFSIEQQAAFTDPSTNRFGFIGRQRNEGAEFLLFGEVAPGFRLLGGATLIDARLSGTVGGRSDGRTPPGVPDRQLSLQAEYDLPFAPGLTLVGRILDNSRVYFDVANTQVLAGWTRFDVAVRYATLVDGRPAVFRLGIDNLTDVSYWQTAGRSLLSLGSPRTILVSASFDL
jgi:iron complex outermembrane receptor protein